MKRRNFISAGVLATILLFYSLAAGAVLPAPVNLTAVQGNGEISLAWEPVSGATGYIVYRGEKSSGPFRFVARPWGSSFTDRDFLNGSTYFYVVTAFNADGESDYSLPVGAMPVNAVLKSPGNITAIAGNGQVSLIWQSVAGAAAYYVFRAAISGGPYTLLTTTPVTGSSYTDINAANGMTWYYVIRSCSVPGCTAGTVGAFSEEVRATPSAKLPSAPTSLVATPGSGWAKLRWEDPDSSLLENPVYAYAIYRGNAKGGPYELVAMSMERSFEENLTNGVTYYYVVRGVNAVGRGAFSEEIAVTPSALEPPHAPVLQAFWGDSGRIDLSWGSAAGAVSYKLYRSQTPGDANPTLLKTYAGSSIYDLRYTDWNLADGTRYYYFVEAVNDAPQPLSSRSSEVAVTPVAKLPAPDNLRVWPGNAEATVTWDPVPGAASYYVTVAETPGGTAVLDSWNMGTGRTYYTIGTVIRMTNDKPYYIRVRTSSKNRTQSDYSEEIVVTPAYGRPHAPTDLKSYVGNSQVSLRWAPVLGATGYHIYRRSEHESWPTDPVGRTIGPIFTDTGLVSGRRYDYLVCAVTDAGEGAPSGTFVVPDAHLPKRPLNVRVFPGNTTATVVWDPVPWVKAYNVPGVTSHSYRVAVSNMAGGHEHETYIQHGPIHETFERLENGKTYYFRVRVGDFGDYPFFPYSDEVSATPAYERPMRPSGLTVIRGNTEIGLSWSAVAGAEGYKVFRRISGSPWPKEPIAVVEGTFFTDQNLINATQYEYAVAAINAFGAGAWSETISASPTVKMITAPVNLQPIPGDSRVSITWDPVPGATGYEVSMSATKEWQTVATSGSITRTTYTFEHLDNGKTYYFRVQAKLNPYVGSPYSIMASAIPTPDANIGSLYGRITADLAGHPDLGVADATVRLKGTTYTTQTDANGNFTLHDIPYGNYELLVTADNLETRTVGVSLNSPAVQVAVPGLAVAACPTCPACVRGDANDDRRVGLEDVVYDLQVISGIREAELP